ncbi:MAG: PA2779 family protein [Desulfobacterales bacterium]|nr:MAG: PA2779 family protein [Desulfobacterales bacterium]
MKFIRQSVKPVSFFMAIFVLMISGPFQSAYAAMIETESVLDISRGQQARVYLKSLLAREDVQAALVARGLEPQEAKARIDSLSDAEAINAADRFDQLPSASGVFETLLIVAFLVFLILLITDIAGYTDIFPFVHPMKK